tara:strand:+ start:25 stop:204 length:180 start_codon:yes stop_codon:yes gene_type:complete
MNTFEKGILLAGLFVIGLTFFVFYSMPDFPEPTCDVYGNYPIGRVPAKCASYFGIDKTL